MIYPVNLQWYFMCVFKIIQPVYGTYIFFVVNFFPCWFPANILSTNSHENLNLSNKRRVATFARNASKPSVTCNHTIRAVQSNKTRLGGTLKRWWQRWKSVSTGSPWVTFQKEPKCSTIEPRSDEYGSYPLLVFSENIHRYSGTSHCVMAGNSQFCAFSRLATTRESTQMLPKW